MTRAFTGRAPLVGGRLILAAAVIGTATLIYLHRNDAPPTLHPATITASTVMIIGGVFVFIARRANRQRCPQCGQKRGSEYGIHAAPLPFPDHMCSQCWSAAGRLGRRESVRAYKAARSMRDLAMLTAQWLLGRYAVCPTYDGPPDPETMELLRPLVLLNRMGIMTAASQPGRDGAAYNDLRVEQRAFVDVFCPPGLAPSFRRTMTEAGMVVAGVGDDDLELIRGEFTGNRPWRPRRVKRVGVWCASRAASRELAAAEYFTVVDPEWGRPDSPLWDAIIAYATAGEHKRDPETEGLADTYHGLAQIEAVLGQAELDAMIYAVAGVRRGALTHADADKLHKIAFVARDARLALYEVLSRITPPEWG